MAASESAIKAAGTERNMVNSLYNVFARIELNAKSNNDW